MSDTKNNDANANNPNRSEDSKRELERQVTPEMDAPMMEPTGPGGKGGGVHN